jgi:hypothetical protein
MSWAHLTLNKNEETILAESMIRTHGQNAAMRASDNACTHAGMGDEVGAALWRRVMSLIGILSHQDNGAPAAGAVRHWSH